MERLDAPSLFLPSFFYVSLFLCQAIGAATEPSAICQVVASPDTFSF